MKKSTQGKKSTNIQGHYQSLKNGLVTAVENLVRFCETQRNDGNAKEYSYGKLLFFRLKIS